MAESSLTSTARNVGQGRTQGGGGGEGGLAPPPPIQTYTDRPKLMQLRRTLVWLVSLLGGSRPPPPSENPGYAPGGCTQTKCQRYIYI